MKKLLIVVISGCLLGGCVGYDDGPSRGYGSSYYRGNDYTPYYESDNRVPVYRSRDYYSKNYHRDDHDHRNNSHKDRDDKNHDRGNKNHDRDHDNHRSYNRTPASPGAGRAPHRAGAYDYQNGQQP